LALCRGTKGRTALGTFSRGIAFDPLLGNKGAQSRRQYTWIGSANDEVSVCVAWENTGFSTFEDMLTKELTVGSTNIADDTYQFPRILNGVLGTKMKIITATPAATKSAWRWSAARCRDAAGGHGRAS